VKTIQTEPVNWQTVYSPNQSRPRIYSRQWRCHEGQRGESCPQPSSNPIFRFVQIRW